MKIGDRVSVIDEDLLGEITTVIGNEIIIQDTSGFTHRYKKTEVVLRDVDFYQEITIYKKPETVITKKSKKHNKNHLILDLHFDKLVSQPSEYEGFERLFIQKQKLLDTLDFCREHHLKKLEIIHGLGDGTVQKMVENVLQGQINLEFHHVEILHQQSGNVMVYLQ